ncbi:MAG TPA: 50S ribosomal protein L25/general stress protein Ctc [Armatimonadota bacterium]|nr:50S ribosomal protein L25/general stress protein Ctc [Armatimonadota bacterium]
MRLKLDSKVRTDFRKSETKKLRREGSVPATVYGKGIDPVSLAVNSLDMIGILKTEGGRLALIDLKVDGKTQKAHPVMIQEMQRDPITRNILHVDFHRVSMDEPVHASVPIVLRGDAPGVKTGGILEQFTRDLEVKALPDHIPSHIDVDVSRLELGNHVLVGELIVPEDIEVLGPQPDIVVASVRLPHVHVEEVEAAPEELEEEVPAEEEAKEEAEE